MHPKGTCSASLHCVGIAPYETTIDRPCVGADAHIRPSPFFSPSVKTKGFDTSLAEGGKGFPRLRGNSCRLLIAVFGKQGGGFLAVGPGVLADVLNGGLIQLALDPGG